MSTSAPGERLRTLAAITDFSETVAFFRPSKELKKMITPTKRELQQEPSLTLSQK